VKRILMAVVTAVGLMAASTAQALPVYHSGSFAYVAFTSTTTDVTATTSFVLSPPPQLIIGSPTGDFGLVVLPATLAQAATLNFLIPSSLDWTDPGLGSFHATSAALASDGGGQNAFAKWNVLGTFTVGSDFANSGATLSADETWSMTQTGGPGHAISMSGTFDSPSVITPEPATLILLGFGVGLAGLLAMRRRSKTVI
jgi:hypothetical protein